MAGSKKLYPVDFPKFISLRVAGATADTEVKASPGVLARVAVTTAGAASSTVKLFDGTVAAGTQIGGDIDGTKVMAEYTYFCYFDSSLHIETVDSGAGLEVTITYL